MSTEKFEPTSVRPAGPTEKQEWDETGSAEKGFFSRLHEKRLGKRLEEIGVEARGEPQNF
jgi:hypothetical protein